MKADIRPGGELCREGDLRPKIGLALGGGAFRGLAHIGVLRVFAEAGIRVDMLAGTSIGALVGAIFAMGSDMGILEQLCYTLDNRSMWDVATLPRRGIIKGDRIQELALTLTHDGDFADTKIPLTVVACDLSNGRRVLLTEGKLHKAVRASISVPGVFVPYILDDATLVDGALVDRLPDDVVRDMGADIVIAVDVAFRGQYAPVDGIAEVLLRAFDISQWENAKRRTPEVLITPNCLEVNPATFENAREAIEAGRRSAWAALPEIQRMLRKAEKKLRKKGYINKLPRVRVDDVQVTREKGKNRRRSF